MEEGLSPTEALGIARRYLGGLCAKPQLRLGAREGLVGFFIRGYTTVVVTEGPKSKCHDLLRHYELENFVERVIEGSKHSNFYRRVCKFGGANVSVMIGDQLDRDILPAKEAGLVTIYFPGGFTPKWSPIAGGHHSKDYEVASFVEAVGIIAGLERKQALVSKAV